MPGGVRGGAGRASGLAGLVGCPLESLVLNGNPLGIAGIINLYKVKRSACAQTCAPHMHVLTVYPQCSTHTIPSTTTAEHADSKTRIGGMHGVCSCMLAHVLAPLPICVCACVRTCVRVFVCMCVFDRVSTS